MQTVEEYLADKTQAQQAEYERIKKIVVKLVPDIEETISYGIPTFKYKGKYVLYFGAFKDHMSVFPGGAMVDEIKDRLAGFKLAKGTIQYTEQNLIPKEVIEEFVRNRIVSISRK